MEFKDKQAKIITDALKLTKDKDIVNERIVQDIVRYANIVDYLKSLEKDYYKGDSPLTADTFYELYSTFCDDFLLENFCAKAIYFNNFNGAIYADEIVKTGEKRLMWLYKLYNENSNNAGDEYLRLATEDQAYYNLVRERNKVSKEYDDMKKKADKTSTDMVKLIKLKRNLEAVDRALDKKETRYSFYNKNKQTVQNAVCEIITGDSIENISKTDKSLIVKNFVCVCKDIEAKQVSVQ